MKRDYDVVIAGAGMVGSALASGLSRIGLQILLIEPDPPVLDWQPGPPDSRVSALGRASQRILQRLGAWQVMCELGVSPYREMRVWDEAGGSIHFESAAFGEPDLGHIVENRVIRRALWEGFAACPTLELATDDRVAGFEYDPGKGMQLRLESGREILCALLVGCEGAQSAVREAAGIRSTAWAYDQHAVVANIHCEQPSAEVARQRFLADGPLAFLPLADGGCSIVWSTSPEHARQLVDEEEEWFLAELTRASNRWLGQVESCGQRASFPLQFRNAERYVLPGLALVGDAAHGIHPLAGQGVNLGFLDAATLVDVLEEALRRRRPLGSLQTLRRYERARRAEDLVMLTLTDLFKRTFSNRNPLLSRLRSSGLELADRVGPLKHLMARRGMGLDGPLPRLARL